MRGGSLLRSAAIAAALLFALPAGATPTPADTAADTGASEAPPDPGGTSSSTGTPTPTVDPDTDADLDGWTVGEGDCDDNDRAVHPGLAEVCNDRADNDCDGLFDEGCDDTARFASLRGGGGCSGNSGIGKASFGPGVLLLGLIPLWRRRRR
ncbi:MAG: putative metal-binding motif-containing protein [Myxococcota bacterium]